MWQEPKFGEVTARRGDPDLCASSTFPASCFSASPITNHHSQITAFLINTPAIRIAPKSFHCNAALHSNRHSSGAWGLHRGRAGYRNADRKVPVSKGHTIRRSGIQRSPVAIHQSQITAFPIASAEARPTRKNNSKLPFSHTNSTLFGCADPRCYPSKIALGREFS
jgi:hypothetical protein